jgi:hypothetical protein
LTQLNVPVGEIEEMLPTIVVMAREADVHEGSPFGAPWLADQLKARFVGKPIALPRVAGDAGANNVFPSCLAATIPWKDVIQIQIVSLILPATVLAGVLVPFEDIVPRKLDLFLWQPLEEQQ